MADLFSLSSPASVNLCVLTSGVSCSFNVNWLDTQSSLTVILLFASFLIV